MPRRRVAGATGQRQQRPVLNRLQQPLRGALRQAAEHGALYGVEVQLRGHAFTRQGMERVHPVRHLAVLRDLGRMPKGTP